MTALPWDGAEHADVHPERAGSQLDGDAQHRPPAATPAEGRLPARSEGIEELEDRAPVVVRRDAGVAALIGTAASAVAIAYLWRASQTTTVLDWTLCAVMAVIAAVHLAALVDARTPLLVADDLGVRIRLGSEWRGLPWEAVGQVVVHPRRGVLRDGRLVLAPRSLGRALGGLDARARRHVALNQTMYGAPLAVPLGITTRLSTARGTSLAEELTVLALGRSDVLELDPETLEVRDPQPSTVLRESRHTPRRSPLGGLGTVVSRAAKGRANDVDGSRVDAPHGLGTDDTSPGPASGPPAGAAVEPASGSPSGNAPAREPARRSPLRVTRPGLRSETTLAYSPSVGSAALQIRPDDVRPALPEGKELRRPGGVDLVVETVVLDNRVRPMASLGSAVEPLVVDDFAAEPAYDPIIGPELAAARSRLGLSVDDLGDRTRIRPHVIESIEVDDFVPCGGDFYARGHLRTLARILGKDVDPLLARFEERYATAPVTARRVFEAELATGTTGAMRSTVGGANWGLLVGTVLALVLTWGVVRLFTAEPAEMLEVPAPILNGAGGVESSHLPVPDRRSPPDRVPGAAPAPVAVRLSASQSDSLVVVRDAGGKIVFSGEMVLGERRSLQVSPPVRIRAADGGAIEVRVAGRDSGFLGPAGEPVRRTFARP